MDETINIKVYDKVVRITTTMAAVPLSENIFRVTENEIINDELTVDTEFETRVNEAGRHEVVWIVKQSDYIPTGFCYRQV